MSDQINSLELLVKKWALKKYFDCRGYQVSDLDLQVDVDLNEVKFSCEKPVFTKTRRAPLDDPSVVFTSTVNNKTDTTQESMVSVKRTTSAVAKIQLKNGFVADHIFGTKLENPPEAQRIFDKSVDIDLEENNHVERTIDWTFKSSVKAVPQKVTKTFFEVKEEQLISDFSTYVKMKGPVSVEIKDKKTGLVLFSDTETIRNIIVEILPVDHFPDQNTIWSSEGSSRWPFRGQMSFQYGITQNERVESN